MALTQIPGYTYGSESIPRSPVTLGDLDLLQKAVTFTEEDRSALQMAGNILKDYIDEILDLWYGFVASYPHLIQYFSHPDGRPDTQYLNAVRERFGQWILDTCNREYDQEWLDYQYEISLRHTFAKKNQTDGADAPSIIHLRYLIAFIYPLTATIKPFLQRKGHSSPAVEKMYNAWFKSLTMQIALWSYPYCKDDHF